MQSSAGKSIKSLVERIVERRVPADTVSSSNRLRLPVTGVPAKEYVLRRVASRRVELRSVALKSVCRQVCNSVSPVQSPPRLALAHVFACLKAAAAKSTSSRLLGRTALPALSSSPRVGPVASRGLSSVSARLSVSPSVSKSASVRVSVAYPRLN